jgi:hypothetical protein
MEDRGWRGWIIEVRVNVQNVQAVQPLRSVQTPTSFLPRVAGEDEGGGAFLVNFASLRLGGINRSYLKSWRLPVQGF